MALSVLGCGDQVASVKGRGTLAAVHLDEGGNFLDLRLVPREASVAFAADEGQLLATFDLEGLLLDRQGRPVAPERLRAVDVQTSSAAGCGRCRVPGSDRLHLGPGDRCPIPGTVKGQVFRFTGGDAVPVEDSLLLSAVLNRLRIAWPGACDTAPANLDAAPGIAEVCGLTPPEAGLRSERVAVAPDGAVVGVRSGYGAFIGSVGFGVSGPLPGFLFGDLLAPSGPLRPFFVANGGLIEVGPLGLPRAVALPPEIVDARGLARLEEGAVHVFGADPSFGPAVARCALERDGRIATCSPEEVDCLFALSPLVDGVPGTGVARALDGNGRIYRRQGARWTCGGRLGADGQEGFRPTRIEQVEQVGDWLWVCADGLEAGVPGGVGLLAANLDAVNLDFEVKVSGPGLACSGFSTLPGSPDRLILTLAGTGARIGPDGDVVALCDGTLRCAPEVAARFPEAVAHGVLAVDARPDGAAVVGDLSGRLHVSPAGAAESQIIFGDAEAEPFASAALAAGPDGAWVFSGSQVPHRFVPAVDGCGQLEEGPATRGTPRHPLDRARAAAFVAGRGYLVGGERLDGEVWLRDIDVATGALLQVGLQVPAPSALVDLGRGGALWVTDNDLFFIPPGQSTLEPIAVAWDDPATVIVESAPASSVWLAADQRDGVTWVVGAGRVARVLLDPEGRPRAEGWWSFRIDAAQEASSVSVLEPDRVIFLERVFGFDGRAGLRVGLLDPACGLTENLGVCPLFANELAPLSERRPEFPGPLVLHPDGLLLTTFFEGLLLRGPSAAFNPFGFLEEGVAVPGGALLSGFGKVAFIRYQR
ncbi:MAG: hypothetical protein AAFZ18_15955 [Myxococcota bacterium]